MKFKDKVQTVTKNPVFIVGINPGRQRNGGETKVVWEGNRSGDFISSVVKNQKNVVLTNVCNYQEWNEVNLEEGLKDLLNKIELYQPRKIICLGTVPFYQVTRLFQEYDLDIKIHSLPHPSFILRFNKDRREYQQKLLKLLED